VKILKSILITRAMKVVTSSPGGNEVNPPMWRTIDESGPPGGVLTDLSGGRIALSDRMVNLTDISELKFFIFRNEFHVFNFSIYLFIAFQREINTI